MEKKKKLRVLIVEDEQKVASFLKKGLEENHYEADVAYDGHIGKLLANRHSYDIMLLDVILPGMNGFDLCREIKAQQPQTPVLLLSALGATDDKLTGFDSGTDDYLVKPFEFKELLARIHALTRRSHKEVKQRHVLSVADLELDLQEKVARRGGDTIHLTAKEFSLLEYFMHNNGRVISRTDIAEKVWNINFDTGTNVVDVYVNLLRKKIDKNYSLKLIHTRIGMGYIFKEEAR